MAEPTGGSVFRQCRFCSSLFCSAECQTRHWPRHTRWHEARAWEDSLVDGESGRASCASPRTRSALALTLAEPEPLAAAAAFRVLVHPESDEQEKPAWWGCASLKSLSARAVAAAPNDRRALFFRAQVLSQSKSICGVAWAARSQKEAVGSLREAARCYSLAAELEPAGLKKRAYERVAAECLDDAKSFQANVALSV